MPDLDELQNEINRLKDEVSSLKKINDSLVTRIDGGDANAGSDSSTLETNILLQNQVKERADDMQASKELAEAVASAKSEFLSMISHEIRTPMNAIIGMTHLALKTELTPKQHDYLCKVDSSAQSLLKIINDILDFSRIEAGKLDIENVEFNLEDVLDNLSNLVTFKVEEKGLEIIFGTLKDVPSLLVGDPLRIGQILLNLASNAAKFTESGEIVITIEQLPESTKNDNVTLKFTIKDTGIGLTEEEISKLFQAFSQADISTTRKYGGIGLGLSICKRLVELMGGEIWVESEPNKGSSFVFTVKLVRQKTEKEKQMLPPAELQGSKILVVDDNATSRTILKSLLESFSFKVTAADSGKEGLRLLEEANREDPYKLALIDWKMPEMDGIQTSKLIKKNTNISLLPTILMATTYAREEVIHQAEEAKLDGFLIKPVNTSAMFDTIMEAFGQTVTKRIGSRKQLTGKNELLEKIRGSKILLVEDNAINQQVATEILENAGFVITIANNGREAIKKVGETDFDAVLMDLQMPEMDGYAATRAIRKWERRKTEEGGTGNEIKSNTHNLKSKIPGLPIIAMTAQSMVSERERGKCLKAGMNDYSTKPIEPEKLFATLIKWIKPKEISGFRFQNEDLKKETFTPLEKATEPLSTVVREHSSLTGFTQSKTQDPSSEIPDLPGIDIETGISRVGGKKRIFLKLIMEFGDQYNNAENEIRKLLKDGDLDTARRLAHTIKGVSGTLGAMELYTSASELESAIEQERKETFSALIDEFARTITLVVESIKLLKKGISKEKTTLTGPVQLEIEKVKPLLNELSYLIKQNSMDAENCLEKLNKLLSGHRVSDIFKKLEDSINDLEYEDAASILLQIVEALDISLEEKV